jgi:hypothetical protein
LESKDVNFIQQVVKEYFADSHLTLHSSLDSFEGKKEYP